LSVALADHRDGRVWPSDLAPTLSRFVALLNVTLAAITSIVPLLAKNGSSSSSIGAPPT
jgi:hypothetical protein